MNYCSDCGEYTTNRGAFGEAVCAECHEAQDAAVESFDRRVANKLGYQYGWRDERPPAPARE